ncbi:Tfp pilus assembly protein FimT/FimU [Sulfurospirillum sp. UCH001]|uniref:pilus assembly FimT family protein n=1 Tax=Sulfurospirillum sp. UCH001 TaxID=1581011 RepID=UPI000837426E|nr:type II secretion system protein [Sulfurospirillum sp. UCH001]
MKKAFTMLELVFVIVIVGILSYFVSSSFQRNPLREAADQVVSHIRYTQHLAMIDDKFDPNDATWFRENWQFEFRRLSNPLQIYYVIYSDTDQNGNADTVTHREVAIDPLTKNYLDGTNTKLDITKSFGITNVQFTANCHVGAGIGELSFDVIGRPYYYTTSTQPPQINMYQYLLMQDCNITLVNPDGNITITITPETGYTYISAQNY